MPIYQNKALQDQMMRVATQGQQRSINDKARQAAVAKAIGGTGQVAAKAYSANSAEVMRQAKELGLSSPEEVAGLKKVMEASERTGLSIEEIMNSDKMMAQLQKEAVAMRDKKSSLDESLGELKEMRDVQKGKAEELQSLRDMKTRTGKDLTLPYMGADKKLEGIDSRIGQTKRQIADNTMSKEKLAQMAKLQALDDLGISGDGLTAARRSVSAKQKLDKLASSNLVGRDMVGRMASEGSREGMKEVAKQRLATAQANRQALDASGKARSRAIGDMTKVVDKMSFRSDKDQDSQMRNYFVSLAEVGVRQGLTPEESGALAGSLLDSKVNSLFEGINKETRKDIRDKEDAAAAVAARKEAADLRNSREISIKKMQNEWNKEAKTLDFNRTKERDTMQYNRGRSTRAPETSGMKNPIPFGGTEADRPKSGSGKKATAALKAAEERIRGLEGTDLNSKLEGFMGTKDPAGMAQVLIRHVNENPSNYWELMGIERAEADRFVQDAQTLLGAEFSKVRTEGGGTLPSINKKMANDPFLKKFAK